MDEGDGATVRVEVSKQGVDRPVSTGAGAVGQAVRGLFLDRHVGGQVGLCGCGIFVSHPERDDRGVHARVQEPSQPSAAGCAG